MLKLTPAERRVLEMLADGFTDAVIADYLGYGRGPKTVQSLIRAGAHAYWRSTGLPMKYGVDGVPIWPESPPTHPAQTAVPGQHGSPPCRHGSGCAWPGVYCEGE